MGSGNSSDEGNEGGNSQVTPFLKGGESISPRHRLSSQIYTSTFFGLKAKQKTDANNSDCAVCASSEFQPVQIKSSVDSLTVVFPIVHHRRANHFLDVLDGIPSANFLHKIQNDKQVSSLLQFKFGRDETQLYLRLSCTAYTDSYQYPLNDVLATFVKTKINPESNASVLRVLVRQLQVPAGSVQYLCTEDDLDYDGVDVKHLLEGITVFNLNCLNRFAELTDRREDNLYEKAICLGKLLEEMLVNYKSLSEEQYRQALEYLQDIEASEIYRNDPLIALSRAYIKDTVTHLSKRAMYSGRGVAIDRSQLEGVLQALVLHEGQTPEHGIWFPHGSVEQLKRELEPFLINDKTIENRAVSCH